MSLFDKTHNTDPVEVAFGCRSHESRGEGYWDGAFVIIKSKDDVFKAFTFEYKKDTISELDNLELAIDLCVNTNELAELYTINGALVDKETTKLFTKKKQSL